MTDSEQLLVEFARTSSERAFGELVTRHLDLVYSVALRGANGDQHMAEDISQVVFADLAKKAQRLEPGTRVAGWLYRHTRFTTAKMIRGEKRRQTRELLAMQISSIHEREAEPEFDPHLDEVLEKLSGEDREAVLLRFFRKMDFRSLGHALGVSEDAAQKRVSRALEKARTLFEQRGVAISALGLAAAFSKEAMPAPAGLATQILSNLASHLAGSAAGVAKFALNSKMKTAILAVSMAGVATTMIWQGKNLSSARAGNASLQKQLGQIAHARSSAEADAKTKSEELDRLRSENRELHRLRAEVTELRRAAAAQPKIQRTDSPAPIAATEEKKQVTVETRFIEFTPEALNSVRQVPLAQSGVAGFYMVLSPGDVSDLLKTCEQTTGVDLLSAPKVTTLDGRQARVSVTDKQSFNGQEIEIGQILDILPSVAPDLSGMNLTLDASSTDVLETDANTQIPRFRIRSGRQSASVPKHHSLLMGLTDKLQNNQKRLVVLVTPSIIDAAGNLIPSWAHDN